MKILFVGDASNLHSTLAKELRSMGHTADVVSAGSGWMNTDRNISLLRGRGIAGTLKYIYDIIAILPKLRGYDVVQLSNPIFLSLRPGRVRKVFDYLKKNNGKICLSALGTDYDYVQVCHDGKTFRYSDYLIGDRTSPYMLSPESAAQGNWQLPAMRDYHRYVIDNVDGVIACLYEYFATYAKRIPDKLAYGGIPIDTASLKPHYIDETPQRVKFFVGVQRQRNVLKGTDLMLDALRQLHDRYPDQCEMKVVENVPYQEYVATMRDSHVILDQLYSYTPATNALIAMAQGIVAVSGAEPEYYEFIGERDLQPIINVSPMETNGIYKQLEWILLHKEELPRLSRESREFVVKHNDSRLVAQRHIDFWNNI